jgi:hypothetical protein
LSNVNVAATVAAGDNSTVTVRFKNFKTPCVNVGDCEIASEGICAIDWDFVIDGQDYHLSNVNVAATVAAGDNSTVTVRFKNFKTPCVNVYYFVREGGVWKVDDIETRQGAEAPIRMAKMLRDFDYNQR